ncbi:RagB/SusD family nutrient uptake outer membrane protein [Marinoscillum sp. MHG1-6]|uniref:RagB/SusD family nutrient uptake outer membrane protein n=1 Tax=Marinoscillum sp. MHG1-6 TaxID=2959627 RepID=UPI00215760B9|nr:RagB/SusD family nutrient uptake outer membrane protein [Marinoscillum sp. MHG1-6]
MKRALTFILSLASIYVFYGCDIDVEEKDSLLIETASGEFGGVDPTTSLEGAYEDLRAIMESQERILALSEHPSDEYMGPTRGTDWGDNGIWRTLHQHTWSANHNFIRDTWNQVNERVFKLGQILHPASAASTQQAAEAKFLRAWYMYWILDFWGQVPIREPDAGIDEDPIVLNATQAFNTILEDLDDAIADLPAAAPGVANTKSATKTAAQYLKAKLLLNKAAFLGGSEDPADMTTVISLVDSISAEGFALEDDYFEIFRSTDDNETIFWTPSSIGPRVWCGLHYNQPTRDNAGGWNGFTTTSDFYNLFEGDQNINVLGSNQEERRGYVPTDGSLQGIGLGFLIGQQYDSTGVALKDRAGNPLVFTLEMPGISGNNERTGVRIIKYHPNDGASRQHVILMRYADAYLMKVEAILRGGTSSDDPLTMINDLRALREAQPATTVDFDYLLDERGRELYLEMWRRNDLIRFEKFTAETWQFKEASESYRVKFPIPEQALATNPNLIQNEGY